jgi:hypothetical protein
VACVMHSGSPIVTWTTWIPPQGTLHRIQALLTGLSEIPHEVRCPHIGLPKTKVSCKRQHQIRSTMTIICIIPSLSTITLHQISYYSPDIERLLAPLAQCVERWTATERPGFKSESRLR